MFVSDSIICKCVEEGSSDFIESQIELEPRKAIVNDREISNSAKPLKAPSRAQKLFATAESCGVICLSSN